MAHWKLTGKDRGGNGVAETLDDGLPFKQGEDLFTSDVVDAKVAEMGGSVIATYAGVPAYDSYWTQQYRARMEADAAAAAIKTKDTE